MNISPRIFVIGCCFLVLLLVPHLSPGQTMKDDIDSLSQLNARFIKNFITQDTISHNQIIHKDFICIQGSGQIIERDEYMRGWAQSYQKGGYTSFGYADENIRVFGSMALVRSRTIYTKVVDGKTITGGSVYIDTYIKENGRWWCVQAQITRVG